MARIDKRVYLEPRLIFDKAIINESTALYSYTKIIDILQFNGMSFIEAIDYFCFNIEHLIFNFGLNVKYDDE